MNWEKKVKPTKSRRLVYEIVSQATKPISAQHIFDQISLVDDKIWLSTIYRNLDSFVKSNIFTKIDISINNDYVCVYKLNDQHHNHFAICSNCHKLINIINCPLDNYQVQLEEKDFKINAHKVEIYGLCSECQ